MSDPVAPGVLATMERLILSRLTAETWADVAGRNALYAAIQARLAVADTSEETREQHLKALARVSQTIEAAASAATDHPDFLDLVAAARDVPAQLQEVPQPGVAAPAVATPNSAPVPVPPVSDGTSVPSRDAAPRSGDVASETKQVREIPIWPFMALIALGALAYAFWPASACSLRSTVCISDPSISSGPGLADAEARRLRVAILGVQTTPTHVFARVRVNNTGNATVHAISQNPMRLAYRLRPTNQPADALLLEQFNPNRIELKQDIPPGATVETQLLAARPSGTAALVLEISFVVEGRFWAFSIGLPPVGVPVP